MAAFPASAEFGLFCLALKPPGQGEHLAALHETIAAGPNWECILEGARRHRVAPLLLAALQTCRCPSPPPAVLAELRREALVAAAASLAQMREVARLSRIFAEARIRMLVLKGVVLSAQLGEPPGLRHSRDIDLLVAPEELAAAQALLLRLGYRSSAPHLSLRRDAAYRRWVKDIPFRHAISGIRLELHHRLSDNPALLPFDFAALWRERDEVAVAGTIAPALPRRFLALYLCAHGAGHGWEELRWLVDLASALGEPGAVEAATAMAEAAGLGRAMRHAVLLAHRWLALPAAEARPGPARPDRRLSQLDRILAHFYAQANWYRTPPRASLAGFLRYSIWLRLYVYSLKPQWRYWRYQAAREFVTPADWEALALPDRLFWVFPLIRLFGWILRWRRR